MAYSHCPFEQWVTLKNFYFRDHVENHFEDPIKKKFFNIPVKNNLPRYPERLIGQGLLFIHHSPGGAYRRFDF
jgi:hypothetical protein